MSSRSIANRALFSPAEWVRRVALAGATALLIARPLSVSEDAAQGSGAWFVQLWLAVAVLWALHQVLQRRLEWRGSRVDAAVAVLIGAVAVSSWGAAAPRPAINLAWEWLALGLTYFLIRQLVRGPGENRALSAVLLAVAVTLSWHGLHDYFWGQEQRQSEYLNRPARYLRQANIEPDTAEARRFEDRFVFSREPLATFALANSLAGFLAPWLIVAIAWGSAVWWDRRSVAKAARMAVVTIVVLSMVLCLFLTKSRSAWLGAAAGLVTWLFLIRHRMGRRQRRWLVGGVLGALAVGAVVAAIVGGFDRYLVTAAWQSLSYRWEYWVGTWGVIQEHFWWGVGPGNFQQRYMAHKLPWSSEEIADPHNLFLEVWASSGIVALLGLVASIVLFAQMLRRAVRTERSSTLGSGSKSDPQIVLPAPIVFGGGAGFVLLLLLVPLGSMTLVGYPETVFLLLVGWVIAMGSLWTALKSLPLGPAAFLAGTVALLVNLLAAGGVSFPAVAQNLWVLIALGLNAAYADESPKVVRGSLAAVPVAAIAAVIFVVVHATLTGPVGTARYELAQAEEQDRLGNLASAVRHLEEAVQNDPLSAAPFQKLAEVYRQQWHLALGSSRRVSPGGRSDSEGLVPASEPAEKAFAQAVAMGKEAIQRDPYRPSAHWWLGELYLEHYYRHQDLASAKAAREAFARCVELYPNNAAYRAVLAEAYWLVGDSDQSESQVQVALRLLSLIPHADKRQEALEVFRRSAQQHPRNVLRQAQWVQALWEDVQYPATHVREFDRWHYMRDEARRTLRLMNRAEDGDSLSPQVHQLLKNIASAEL